MAFLKEDQQEHSDRIFKILRSTLDDGLEINQTYRVKIKGLFFPRKATYLGDGMWNYNGIVHKWNCEVIK